MIQLRFWFKSLTLCVCLLGSVGVMAADRFVTFKPSSDAWQL